MLPSLPRSLPPSYPLLPSFRLSIVTSLHPSFLPSSCNPSPSFLPLTLSFYLSIYSHRAPSRPRILLPRDPHPDSISISINDSSSFCGVRPSHNDFSLLLCAAQLCLVNTTHSRHPTPAPANGTLELQSFWRISSFQIASDLSVKTEILSSIGHVKIEY